MLAFVVLPACASTQGQKPAVGPDPVEGFVPKGAKVHIARPEDMTDSAWIRTRIHRPFDDTQDGTEAMMAFIRQAEQQGAKAVSEIEMHARLEHDGKPVTCITYFAPSMKTENRSESQWKPGYPPQLDHVIVTRKIWSLSQSQPKCEPRSEKLDPTDMPHEFVGYMYKEK